MIQQSQLARLSLITAIFCTVYLLPQKGISQSIVNVNNITGTASATIPICTVNAGDLSVPVALNYTASGLKVEDYDNSVGLGWRLIAGASISRQVKGFPDDVVYQGNASYSVIKGWLSSTNSAPQTIQSLSLANSGTSNCANEIADATTIANNFNYSYDTEPDYFYINAPGLSCSFVFDATTNHAIKTIPYRDYLIVPTKDANGIITAFTVTNESGIKYTFDKPNSITHKIDLFIPGPYTPPNDPSTLEIFKRDFQMYRANFDYAGQASGTPVSYNDQWGLSKIEDTKGNKIYYNYEYYSIANPEINNRVSHQDIEIIKPDGSGGYAKKKLYGTTKSSSHLRLLSISALTIGNDLGTYDVAQFSWNTGYNDPAQDKHLTNILLPRESRALDLIYTQKFISNPTVWAGYGRYFLKSVKSYKSNGACNAVNSQFDFTYYNVNEAIPSCYCTPVISGGTTAVDTIINAQDYWGYYNGNVTNPDLTPKIYAFPDNPSVELFKVYPIPSLLGSMVTIPATADRSVNPDVLAGAGSGSLKTITYPTGAVTLLEYENNEFFDKDVNGNVLGGGIRIKKITNNDGLNNNDITLYSYNDPANPSLTTGRAISVPKFAVAFQNNNSYATTAEKVQKSTYRTKYDLNNEAKEILYGKVIVKKSGTGLGIGSTIYEYNTSGTFGSTAVTDWNESNNYVARTNLTSPTPCTAIAPSFLYQNNTNLIYPFTSDANFDFERGLLTKVTQKNEAGQTVATQEYTYDRSHTTPTKIYGLKLDDIGNTMAAYGKYAVNTTIDNFLLTKASKLYNSNSTTPLVDIESYEYTPKSSSLPYRLLKSVSKQNSDGATNISKYKYAKEYGVTGTSADDMNNAIYNFVQNNNNKVIESSQDRVDASGTKTISASISLFKPFAIDFNNTVTKYLPNASYQFINQVGITNFVPSAISAGVFTKDNTNYVNAPVSIEQYSASGFPQLIKDNSRIPQTVLTTYEDGLNVAEFTNAKPENIAFANFDNGYTGKMTVGPGNTVLTGAGRHSSNCLDFQPNTYIYGIVTKPATTGSFILSFWLKDPAVSGQIYLCVSTVASGPTACTFNPVVSFVVDRYSGSDKWKYYQVKIPYTTKAGATTYRYALGTSVALKIDDILMYPDNSGVTTNSYTTNTTGTNMLTAKTAVNGIGNSYEYDNLGRLWLVRDQFDNIVEMKKYKLANKHTQQIPPITIGYNYQHYTVGVPGNFTASLPYYYEKGDCGAPPIAYRWNFGDGTAEITSTGDPNNNGGTAVSHTYTNQGKYLVTLTASSPGMADAVSYTPPVTNVYPNPLPVQVDAAPPPCFPGGTPVICAAGITQYTSTGQCILSYCAPMTATCNNTNFQLSSITGGSLIYVSSVTWEIAPFGTNDWSVWEPEIFGTGGFTTSHSFSVPHTTSYIMRAKIKFCDNSIVYSNGINVKNGD